MLLSPVYVFLLFLCSYSIATPDISLWPQPQSVEVVDESPCPIGSFSWHLADNHRVVELGINRFEARVAKEHKYDKTGPSVLVIIVVQDMRAPLGPLTNETYRLETSPNKILIEAETVFGILRGLETLRQLLFSKKGQLFVKAGVVINDYPRFPFRGLLVDTSRHFLPVELLLRNLDIMEMNKMNVLHWHIVDSQSFPFKSSFAPDLSNGAFSPQLTYSPADVQAVLQEAYVRGIRVLPEFDTPGHTQSWGTGYPYLLSKCSDGSLGPFDPTNDKVYTFMKDDRPGFLHEIGTTFPDISIHLGGDEVSFNCWASNPEIAEWMKTHNISDYASLEGYYVERLIDIVEKDLRKECLVWQEVFNNGISLSETVVVDVWKGSDYTTIAEATAAGHRVVFSGCYYLDHLHTTPGSFDAWEFYKCDPWAFNGTNEQKELVIGGKAAMWGEHVDETNFLPRVWPRASAVAERLWSNAAVVDLSDAESRLHRFRCSLTSLDVPAEPLGPGFCERD